MTVKGVISAGLCEPARTSSDMPAPGFLLDHTVLAPRIAGVSYANMFRRLAGAQSRVIQAVAQGSARGRYVVAVCELGLTRAVIVRHHSSGGVHRLILTEELSVPPLYQSNGDPEFAQILPHLSPLEDLYSGRDLERASHWRALVVACAESQARFDALRPGDLIILASHPGQVYELSKFGTLTSSSGPHAHVRGWHLSNRWQNHPDSPPRYSALDELLGAALGDDH